MAIMNRILAALTSRLTYGYGGQVKNGESANGLVEILARAYERARNALEYRADNLVRRAAIERILKRIMLLSKDPEKITAELLTELRWAKYISQEETKAVKSLDIAKILEKYTTYRGSVPQDWVVKIASAEIEDLFNLNTDYKQFTFFAFQIIRQKNALEDENLDLLTYFATDKVYAGSDDEQIAYHILGLAGQDAAKEKFEEAWKLFNLAKTHKLMPRINKFVRKQMPPLVIIRDIYFYAPSTFKTIIADRAEFEKRAGEVLEIQLNQMSGKISTAGVRSVLYIFLTKMILAFGLEVPFEIFAYGQVNPIPLAVNLIFPPALMWLVTAQIRLPAESDREALIKRAWYIMENFDQLKNEEDVLKNSEGSAEHGLVYSIFTVLYTVFFIGVFWVIYFGLGKIGYSFFSKFIFIFFLTIIAFFAYRISQIAKVYSWKPSRAHSASLVEILSLPILTIGSRLSVGLSKLNFLAFAFDFILEAPFKIILGFVDDWAQFLSIKKEEQIIE